jgi:hypothetical protein
VPWWKTWRRVKSFSVLCCGGVLGGGGRMGDSAALVMARNDSSREAVTRDAELQRSRRRMVVHGLNGVIDGTLCWMLETNDGQPSAARSHLRASMTAVQCHIALGAGAPARVPRRGDAHVEPLITTPSPRAVPAMPRVRTTCCSLTCLPWGSERRHPSASPLLCSCDRWPPQSPSSSSSSSRRAGGRSAASRCA